MDKLTQIPENEYIIEPPKEELQTAVTKVVEKYAVYEHLFEEQEWSSIQSLMTDLYNRDELAKKQKLYNEELTIDDFVNETGVFSILLGGLKNLEEKMDEQQDKKLRVLFAMIQECLLAATEKILYYGRQQYNARENYIEYATSYHDQHDKRPDDEKEKEAIFKASAGEVNQILKNYRAFQNKIANYYRYLTNHHDSKGGIGLLGEARHNTFRGLSDPSDRDRIDGAYTSTYLTVTSLKDVLNRTEPQVLLPHSGEDYRGEIKEALE